MKSIRMCEIVAFGIYGAVLSAVWVAGNHIHVDYPDNWTTGIEHNYLTPLTPIDAAIFVVMAMLFACVAFSLYRFGVTKLKARKADLGPVVSRWFFVIAAIMVLCWLPYLLLYWPGLVFGDTTASINQALGQAPLNNHHPIPYTLFIQACLNLGAALGDSTLGVALYSVVQMAAMALCLSYLLCWVRKRAHLPIVLLVVMLAVFALMPYYATYSIALWKDPLFSCALVMLTLLLADLAISHGAVASRRSWLVALVFFSLMIVFLRNNGLFIVASCCFACFVVSRVENAGSISRETKKKASIKRLLSCGGVFSASCALGAVTLIGVMCILAYSLLGVSGRMAEAGGIPLSQMANVVVHDGNMSDSDREWLDQMMPLDEYEKAYTPRLVDTLKNNESFSGLHGGAASHWLSMLIRNPDLYVEAWVLETYGFWTLNRPEIWSYEYNISTGEVFNFGDEHLQWLEKRGIRPANLLSDDGLKAFFPLRCVQPPIGVIFWFAVYLAICLALSGRKRLIVALLPTFALIGTLIVATPSFYWPRYAFALQLLIPFYMGMIQLQGDAGSYSDGG